ncbi:hypothetical protein DENSPDRAFT_753694, partial [Dentipellis sp. KUC8613]
YRVIRARWMSQQLIDFLRHLDVVYRRHYRNPIGAHTKSGNGPRVRRSPLRTETGHPPPGLWRNCYDSDWLASLDSWERRDLGIVDEDYEFDV